MARAAALTGMLDLPERIADTLLMARTTQSWLLGGGWSAVDASSTGPFRWVESPAASLLLPVGREGSQRLRVQAFKGGDGTVDLGLELDGVQLEPRRMTEGWHWYEWGLPHPLERRVYELAVRLTRTPAASPLPRDVALSQVELLPLGPWGR